MNPNDPDQSNLVQPQQQPASPEQKPKKLTKKTWIIIAIAVVVAIVAGVMMFGSSGDEQNGQQSHDNLYYDREGFDRSDLSSAIGDPAALISTVDQKAVAYKGTAVVQSCNLLSVEEIRGMGLQLFPNSLTAFERTYFDGQSQAGLDTFPTSLASAQDSNSCGYPINEPRGGIDIDVYQPAYNQTSAIDYTLDRGGYTRQGSQAGYPVYHRTYEGSNYYLLLDGNSAVQIYVNDISDKQLIQKILAAVAKNYKNEKSSPRGPTQFAYDSPLFGKSYLNGCSITKAEDVKELFGTTAKPLITERVATAVGVIIYSLQDGERGFNNIEHDCVRPAISNGFSNRKSFTAETTSYLDAAGAELGMASGRQLDSKVTEISASIGDDVYFSHTTGNNPEMVIRKGRFIINLSMFDQTKEFTDQQMIQALTPIAQKVVSRIQDAE